MTNQNEATPHRNSDEIVIVVSKIVQILDQRPHDVGETAGDRSRIEVRAACLSWHRADLNPRRIAAAVGLEEEMANPLTL